QWTLAAAEHQHHVLPSLVTEVRTGARQPDAPHARSEVSHLGHLEREWLHALDAEQSRWNGERESVRRLLHCAKSLAVRLRCFEVAARRPNSGSGRCTRGQSTYARPASASPAPRQAPSTRRTVALRGGNQR